MPICLVSECAEHGHQMLGSGPRGRRDPVYGSASRLGTHWYGWTWSESRSAFHHCCLLLCEPNLKQVINSCGVFIVFYTGTIEPRRKHFLCIVCDWWFGWKGSWVISSLYWWTTSLVILQIFLDACNRSYFRFAAYVYLFTYLIIYILVFLIFLAYELLLNILNVVDANGVDHD